MYERRLAAWLAQRIWHARQRLVELASQLALRRRTHLARAAAVGRAVGARLVRSESLVRAQEQVEPPATTAAM